MWGNRILLLSEQASLLTSQLVAQLAEAGYATTTVSDANEAWRILAREPYEAIVIETSESGMEEGCLVCRMLRRRWCVPIILLGHSHDKQARINSYRVGADVYLQVPFEMQELLVRLESLLRREEWSSKAKDRACVAAVA